MRVLHVTPSIDRSFGGPTYSLSAYIRASVPVGVSAEVAAATNGSADEIASFGDDIAGGRLHTFGRIGRGAFACSPRLQLWLRANASRFDVVHVHGLLNPVSSLALRFCTQRGLPVVVRPFGTLSQYTFTYRRAWLKRNYFRILDGPNLSRADGVHFTTHTERREAAWHGCQWAERAYVIPPPWIDDAISSSPASAIVRPEQPNVLFLSRLHPKKQVEALIDAWPVVRRRVPAAELIIAGGGEADYVKSLHRRAAALGDKSGVCFSGFVEGRAKSALLAAANVFVLPSLHENFGVAVLEAMAAGVPVVVSREVQLSAFVVEHGLGLISERAPNALSEAIVAAIENPALTIHCRTNGAAIIADHFAPHVVGKQLLEMYHSASQRLPN